MRTLILFVFFANCILPTANCQVKVVKATNQRVIAGMGGVSMNYEVGLKNKTADSLVIDSVKTIAGLDAVTFYFNKTTKAYTELAFGYSLVEPPHCKTCPDSGARQSNFTKGVLIYYTKGTKRVICKVKKFKRLEDKLLP